MQFQFFFAPSRKHEPAPDCLRVGGRTVPLRLVRHRRARRYVLRLGRDGAARVTVPRGGSVAEARHFVQRNLAWLEKQLLRQAAQPAGPRPWVAGSQILFRGELVRLEVTPQENLTSSGGLVSIRFGSETLQLSQLAADLRPAIEQHLRRLAALELPARTLELAGTHGFAVRRVTIRNQRSRWGSCSARGTISLNWRLVQAPPSVRDYIVLHELAHLRHMNHSRRFWSEVERLCPAYPEAERWLKQHSALLR
jgi:predicted metal-dependent hydrolase